MLGNCFNAAVRNLLRNRTNTLISLFGLFLGLTATILIALYVRDEYSYDRFVPNGDRIYQVGEFIEPPGRSPIRLSVTSVTDAPALRLAFPEVDLTTRLAPDYVELRRTGTEKPLTLLAYWADPNFFDLFPLGQISGSLAGALSQPDTAVLTRKAARQLFGDGNPVGRTLDVIGRATNNDYRTNVIRVAAVVEDFPSNSHLNAEVFLPGVASFSSLSTLEAQQSRPGAVRNEYAYTYVRLRAGASIEEVRSRLRAFADAHVPDIVGGKFVYTFKLTPLADIHLAPPSIGEMKPPSDPRVIRAFIGVALLILIVACGNFVSMMTARATRRAIEVGVRKAVGATRRQIMVQFLGESLFYSALALIPAVIAVNLLLPAFNGFLQRQITFDFSSDQTLAVAIVGLGILTGLAAGAYPALYLSRFRPNIVLKGIITPFTSSGGLRQGLVVFQFATLIALLVATLTIYRQTQYAIEDRLRLPTEEIYLGGRSVTCSTALIESIRAIDAVRVASCASGSALTFDHITAIISPPAGDTVAARAAPIDAAFFGLFDIQPVAGRLLSTQRGSDDLLRNGSDVAENPALVVNESAVRALGFTSPDEAVGKFPRWQRFAIVDGQMKQLEAMNSEIVGVVPDFSIGSIREVIEPTAYYLDATFARGLVLKFNGGAIREGLEAVTGLWSQQQPTGFNGRFLSQYMNDLYENIATQSTIFSVFSGVAVALAALGILGLAMFAAERRTKEIGLRKVMGALRTDILLLLGWQFTRPVLIANLIAWPVGYLAMRSWLDGFAYRVELGPLTFIIAGLLALVLALASVASHALLIARAKPVGALRHE